MNNDAIDAPRRTALLIAAATSINFPLDELPGLVLDALDAPADDSLFPYYDCALDNDNPDDRAFMIHLINSLSGSDDDHDYFSHDLDHALDTTEPCSDHGTPCMTCCAPCLD